MQHFCSSDSQLKIGFSLAKPAFILFHLFSLRNTSYEALGLQSGHFSVGATAFNQSSMKEKSVYGANGHSDVNGHAGVNGAAAGGAAGGTASHAARGTGQNRTSGMKNLFQRKGAKGSVNPEAEGTAGTTQTEAARPAAPAVGDQPM